MTRLALFLPLALLLLPSCEKKETPAQSTAAPSAAPVAAGSGQPGSDGEGLPTEEDFEDEAEQKISAQNAEEELDKLEKEISE